MVGFAWIVEQLTQKVSGSKADSQPLSLRSGAQGRVQRKAQNACTVNLIAKKESADLLLWLVNSSGVIQQIKHPIECLGSRSIDAEVGDQPILVGK